MSGWVDSLSVRTSTVVSDSLSGQAGEMNPSNGSGDMEVGKLIEHLVEIANDYVPASPNSEARNAAWSGIFAVRWNEDYRSVPRSQAEEKLGQIEYNLKRLFERGSRLDTEVIQQLRDEIHRVSAVLKRIMSSNAGRTD